MLILPLLGRSLFLSNVILLVTTSNQCVCFANDNRNWAEDGDDVTWTINDFSSLK